jgi:hypothetical protein
MRVLLVQSWLGRSEPPVVPLGLLNLAAVIADRAEVTVFDPNVAERPMEDLRDVAVSLDPDVVGISLRNCDTTKLEDPFNYLPAFAAQVRMLSKIRPRARLVAGGSGFSLFAGRLMDHLPELDAGVAGPGESAVEGILGGEGGVLRGGGSATRPHWDLIDLAPYIARERNLAVGVEAARGCPGRCSYCVYPELDGEPDRRSHGEILADIGEVYARGARHIFVVAPVLNADPEWLAGLLEEMAGRFPGLTWEAYHTPKGITEEYLRLAARAGLTRVGLSPDGTTDGELAELGKGFRTADLRQALDAICRADGIGVSLSFFPVLPSLSLAGSLAAVVRAGRLGRSCGGSLLRQRSALIRLLPGTPLAEELGLSDEDLFVPEGRLHEGVFLSRSPLAGALVRAAGRLMATRGLR